jgi:hypothetical protein
VSENRVLKRMFGLKRDELIGGWRKLHNEEHYNLYSSPNIVRVIKSRRMTWVGHVTQIGNMGIQNFSHKLKRGNCLGNLGMDERIILKWILKK